MGKIRSLNGAAEPWYESAMEPVLPSPAVGETLDRLAGEWWIFQLERGHRYATDDVLTAWSGLRARPRARRVLDLGSGVGSVGLMALLLLPDDARLTAVEVQETSAGLLRKTLAYNRLEERVAVVRSDLRSEPLPNRHELVVANPPYLPADAAVHSPIAQRAGARLELCGDIFDFCAAAARALAEDGRFCFCFAAGDSRPEAAIRQAGLALLHRREVVPREGRRPLLALYTCGHRGQRNDLPPIVVRGPDGARTDAFRAIRRHMLIEA